jgi:lipocalin
MTNSGIKQFFLVGLIALLLFSCSNSKEMKKIDTRTVQHVDVDRYLGTWYEIARFPHSFEKGLVGVTATYSKRKDGKIKVLNQGYKGSLDGKLSRAEGKAKIPDPGDTSRLKVSFFLFFYGDYFIMELDESYQWAMIGSSSPNYFWILSRTPSMDSELYASLLDNARKRGYDLEQLIKVEQAE